MSHEKPSITIIGTGAVGTALKDFFESNGYPVAAAVSRTDGLPGDEAAYGKIIFITTPDDAISKVVVDLSKKQLDWPGRVVVHCSGSLSANVLSTLTVYGAKIASMHPIQTFSRGDDAGRFRGITVSVEGDREAADLLKPIITDMNAKALEVTPGQKQALHLGAVFASNYLVSLMRTVEDYLDSEEIEDGIAIMRPLIEQTLNNILTRGTEEALTGPVSRGDVQTVEAHLTRLIFYPDKQALYRKLGKIALQIAEKTGTLNKEEAEKLHHLFDVDDE